MKYSEEILKVASYLTTIDPRADDTDSINKSPACKPDAIEAAPCYSGYVLPMAELIVAQREAIDELRERVDQLQASCLVKSELDELRRELAETKKMAVQAHSRTTEIEGLTPDDVVRLIEAIKR